MGFYGNPFGYAYQFPKQNTPSLDTDVISVTDTTAVADATVNSTSLFLLKLQDNSIRFEFTQYALWSSGYRANASDTASAVHFNGPMFSDINNTLSPIVGVSIKSNIAGLDSRDVSFNDDKIAIDFTGIKAGPTSYITVTVTFNEPKLGGDGNDVLNGSRYADIMSGGKGNDKLMSSAGADKMDGGAGTDTVSYANATTSVVASLASPQGNTNNGKGDTYTSIENLIGTKYADVLSGDRGANVLSGGLSNDRMTGGEGADSFVFDTRLNKKGNVDTITDFTVADDTIWLDTEIFTKAGTVGDLASNAFHSGTAASDASDRIIYDKATGRLYYDADGTGKYGQMLFAIVDKGLNITAADFDIIA
jgi:Ca2+-binding RTX toxin-like protein